MKNEIFSKFVLFLNQKTNYTFGTRIEVPFHSHFNIAMGKDIFVYFNFISKLKIEKGHFFVNFQFPIFI